MIFIHNVIVLFAYWLLHVSMSKSILACFKPVESCNREREQVKLLVPTSPLMDALSSSVISAVNKDITKSALKRKRV